MIALFFIVHSLSLSLDTYYYLEPSELIAALLKCIYEEFLNKYLSAAYRHNMYIIYLGGTMRRDCRIPELERIISNE